MSNIAHLSDVERERVLETLQACWEYFDNRADADCRGDPLEFVPNEEMRLLSSVNVALAALGDAS